ncbi:RICIN domain-containing protein [Actinoplanes sp. NBC_00393]|uniref:hypothetical protein n=1 Tax=Actinoplanes sp. NBC_00393 TaxID=2975953 RepID=UPI002E1E4007
MGRFLKFVAVIALIVAGSAVVTSPASAAAPAVTIMHAHSYACLYQSFNSSGATITVYFAESPCAVSGGNAQWRFQYVGGNNEYRVVNNRWDARGLWCLSAPNGLRNVYAELCVPGTPAKQRWRPVVNSPSINGWNRLRNVEAGGCLYRSDTVGYRHIPMMAGCTSPAAFNNYEDFKWL